MKLYDGGRAPNPRRVKVFLAEKGITVPTEQVDLGKLAHKSPEYTAINPLQHYDSFGWKEGRDPGANFDTEFYLLHNPDVKAAHIDPLAHYLQNGIEEGRATSPAVGMIIVEVKSC